MKNENKPKSDFDTIEYYEGDIVNVELSQDLEVSKRSALATLEKVSRELLDACANLELYIRNLVRDTVSDMTDIRIYADSEELVRLEVATCSPSKGTRFWSSHTHLSLDIKSTEPLIVWLQYSIGDIERDKLRIDKYDDGWFAELLASIKSAFATKQQEVNKLEALLYSKSNENAVQEDYEIEKSNGASIHVSRMGQLIYDPDNISDMTDIVSNKKLRNRNFISTDKQVAINNKGEIFTIGDITYHQSEGDDTATITGFDIDESKDEVKVYTDKGYTYVDFISKVKW